MKIPGYAKIPKDKLVRYLLLPREESDKSRFLALAGYTLAHWDMLERDLRQLIRTREVSSTEVTSYGTKYEVRGTLVGPNGRTLHVVTVWIKLKATGETRFVTLFPDKEVRQ